MSLLEPIELAAQYLADARRRGGNAPRLPENCRPADEASALAIQARIVEILGEPVGGWKVSLPNAKGTLIGPVLASTIYPSSADGACVPCPIRPRGEWARIEPEIAFVLGRGLPARQTPYSPEEVHEAVAETRLVLELVGNRYAEPETVPHLEILADCLNNQGLFLGPRISQAPARCPIRLTIGGASPREIDGRHPDGDPFGNLLWGANFLAARQSGMRAGQVVTTGSFAGVLQVPLNVPIEIVFEGLGSMAVQFHAA
jgi:2-keto-4-pentenoate hydratase